ncbi:hypothetical protein A8B75_13910 [Sphingomonadales bacterium EhC05]|nr:hypothetical protein A8B75_13910 [Sphingomonadales bacterium EhC05]
MLSPVVSDATHKLSKLKSEIKLWVILTWPEKLPVTHYLVHHTGFQSGIGTMLVPAADWKADIFAFPKP